MNSKIYIDKVTFLVMAFMGGAFYLLNVNEPLRCDDLIYQFHWYGERNSALLEPVDLNNRVDGFLDSFESQCNHYLVMNGRFVVHFIVQCFCGFLGRDAFSIINTIVYVFFLLGCLQFLKLKNGLQSVAALSVIWLGLPILYIFWYSIAFSVNYLWTSTALIYYFILINRYIRKPFSGPNCVLLLLFIISVVMGALHEGFSLPLSGALFFYILFNRKKVNRYIVFMSIGVWIGTLSVVLSPGIIGRGSSALQDMDMADLLIMKLDVLRYSKRFFLLIIAVGCFWLYNRKETIEFLSKRPIELLFVVLDFLLVLAMPHYSQRIEFPLEMLSLLLLMELVYITVSLNIKQVYLSLLFCTMMIVHSVFTIYYAQLIKNEYEGIVNHFFQSDNGVVNYHNYCIPKVINPYVHRLGDEVEWNYISFVYGKKIVVRDE